MEVTNAIQYLKESGFADSKSNLWINPILNKALNEEIHVEDIDDLIDTIVKREEKPEVVKEKVDLTAATSEEPVIQKIEVATIEEISEVTNFGLLNISQPIPLNKGLNIFYGMNGVGKSSLYKSICGALGLESRKCVPNINSQTNKMTSKIKIIDKTSTTRNFEFTADTKSTLDVRIFDSFISNFIVTNDHENEFEVPYLKQEYFIMIRELLDNISIRLSYEKNNIYNQVNATRQLFKEKLDFINEDSTKIQEKIKNVQFLEEDQQNLNKLLNDKLALESDKNSLILKSYNDRIDELDKVLKKLCVITTSEPDEKIVYSVKFTTQFINKCTLDLCSYANYKELYECNNIDKIGEFIPKDWISKKEWIAFIEAGLNFTSSLIGDDISTYSGEKCPYCNQVLDDTSKELIRSYNNLKSTCKTDMDKQKNIIDAEKKEITELINFVDEIEKIVNKAFESIKEIDEKQVNDFNSTMIKSYFEAINVGLDKYEAFSSEGKDEYLSSVNRIIEFKKILSDKISEIKKQISDKDNEIKRLKDEINPLETKKTIVTNTERLNELVKKLKVIEDIDDKTSCITKLKSSLSKHQTTFSSESIVKLFKEKLYDEYEQLNFEPPKQLTIKPKVKTRLCRIGNYKVNEIYSEGELKIHALAEFFATSIIDNYKGVYIFDDPVNSLDYERMDYVKERIIRLVKEGNQVLVFTHNIYFLYSLTESKIIDRVNEVIKGDYQIQVISDTSFGKDKEYTDKKKIIDRRMTDFSKEKDKSKISIIDLSAVYDLMSGCLEAYVENKLLYGIISRYRSNIRMDNLDDLKKMDIDKLDKVNTLYRKTSRFGNRHDRPTPAILPNYGELEKHYELFKEIVQSK